MVCERCNKKQVSVIYRESAGGRSRALRLCGDCAETLEQAGELEEVSNAVSDFISPRFFPDESGSLLPLQGLSSGGGKEGERASCKCPLCGATVGDITAGGKVGCATCYTIFHRELEAVVHSAHGRVEHTGRLSAGYRARLEKTERLMGLRKQLKEAVSGENFESAAGLRDAIRALEAEL